MLYFNGFLLRDIKQLSERMQQLFEEVVGHFQSTHQYDKFIKEAEKEYDLKIYRLSTFSRQYACHIQQELSTKYLQGELSEMPLGWHQNQRRLYVWFIVCFIHMKMLEPNKLIDLEKYERHWKNISNTFHHKEIPFLKYQLLTIIKNKGRTHWKTKEDELLKEAYAQFKPGQWNEVAKYFYIHSKGDFFKTPKQCRERWQNHLNSEINHKEWTKEEDIIILECVKKNNTKWASIIPELGGTRTEHMIKNRYKSLINKILHEQKMTEGEAVLELLKNLTGPASKLQEQKVVRDEEGIIQVESQEIVDEEPLVIEKKTRKEKKRGRPKKVSTIEVKNGNQSRQLRKSVHIAPSLNNTFNHLDIRYENNNNNTLQGAFDGMSQSRINPMLFNNPSNLFLNDSRNDFFRSGLSFNNHSFIRWENDNSSIFADPMRSRSKRQGGFQPFSLEGDSLIRSRKMSLRQSNDSLLFSEIMKDGGK